MAVLPTPASPRSTGFVLRAAAENLDDALDFVYAANDRVEFVLPGQLGEGRVQTFGAPASSCPSCRPAGASLSSTPPFARSEIRVEFLENFVPATLDIHVE